MNFFNLFKKSTPSEPLGDFSPLVSDMHAHLLPGIDDGPDDMYEALTLIRGMQELGFRQLIATPHVMSDLYPNTKETILERYEMVKRAMAEAGIGIELKVAAEYLLDENFEAKMNEGELLPLTGQLLLVEMGFISEPPNLHDLLFRLQTKGFTPVLAHPERYGFYQGDIEAYRTLQERGCKLQLNMLSLRGHYGPAIQRTAEKLLEAGLVDFLGSDLHNEVHLEELQKALRDKRFVGMLEGRKWGNPELMER